MSRIARTFPQQTKLGGPTWHSTLGVAAPQKVLPLPTLAMQTVTIRGVAIQVRVAYPRRRSRFNLSGPIPSRSFIDTPSGSASASGSVVESKTGADTQQASASPSGTLVEGSITGSKRPVVVTVLAGNRRGHVLVRPPEVVTATRSSSDTVTGSSASSGSSVDALTHSSSVSGAASATGSLVDSFATGASTGVVYVQMSVGRRNAMVAIHAPAVIRQTGTSFSETPVGRSSASGSLSWAEIHVSTPTGTASPSGTLGESFGGPVGPIPLKIVSRVVTQSRLFRSLRRTTTFVFAPAIIDPTPTPPPAQTTLRTSLQAVNRAGAKRRRGKVANPIARVIGPAVYLDTPTGSAAPSGSVVDQLTHAPSVSGVAAPSGSVAQTKLYGDTISGTAAASGSVTQTKIGNDLVTGTSTAHGSATDSFSSGNTFSDNPVGAASPSGTRTESLTGTNTVSGTRVATGSLVDLKLYPEGVRAGAASPTGSLFGEQHIWNDTPTGVTVPPTGVMTFEALTVSVFVSGTSSATGSVREKLSHGSGQPVHFKTTGWRNRWSVKLRV